jgi:hypothetical protein
MEEKSPQRAEFDRFLLAEIDSIPHLEAVLLIWKSRPKQWSVEELSRSLYVPVDRARAIVHDLALREVILLNTELCCYNDSYRHDIMITQVDTAYRQELVRITNLIHSKASPSVREFARAFRLKKN